MTRKPFTWRFKPTSVEFFCLLIGEILVFWYAWIMDDAYVYFRYVDNLVIHGQGLVWNPGEYVEGFSSPLWALLLVVLRSLHLNYWFIIRTFGMVCFAAFWWLACLVNRGLIRDPQPSQASLNVPLVYLSLTYGVLCYFTSGLESPLIAVCAAAYAAAVLWPGHVLFQVMIGLSPLVRHELIIPYMVFVAYVWWRTRRVPWPALATCFAALAAYGFFRVWYYADLFPNTFYLKDTAWVSQGLIYVYDTCIAYQTVPYLLAMGLLYAVLRGRAARDDAPGSQRAAMILIAVPVLLYVIRIGGDPRHFRYLVFPYVLFVLSTGGLLESVSAEWSSQGRARLRLALVFFALAVFGNYPRQLQQHPVFGDGPGYRHEAFMLIKDAAVHRYKRYTPHWSSSAPGLSYAAARERYGNRSGATPLFADWCCYNAYYRPSAAVIQDLGLCEPFLARTTMPALRPAHKPGLRPMGADILEIRARYGFRAGAFDQALADGPCPQWIRDNIEVIDRIEAKVYGERALMPNIRLALTPTGRILPPARGEQADAEPEEL